MTLAPISWITENSKEFQKKTSTSASLTTLKPLTVHQNKLWKILKEMGIPDHLTCLLRNLYAGQEATVTTGHGTMDWLKIGKGVMSRLYIVTLIISITSMQSTSCEMLGWMKHKLESRLPGDISTTSDMQMIPS